MAAAIIPLATSLLPMIVPEVKGIISLIHTAFHKSSPPPNGPVLSTPSNGPAKMDTAITLVQGLLQSLQGSGVVIPQREAIQGFIEALYQTMKTGGELPATKGGPTPFPNPVGAPPIAKEGEPIFPFRGTVLNLEPTPVDDSNKNVVSIKAGGRTVMVTP